MTDKMKELARELAREGLNNDLCVKITVYPLVMSKMGDAEVREMMEKCMKAVQEPVKYPPFVPSAPSGMFGSGCPHACLHDPCARRGS